VALKPEVKDGILTLVVPLLRARHPAVLVHTRLETRGRWGLKLKVTLAPQDTPVTRNNHLPNPRGDASSSSSSSGSGGSNSGGFGSGEGGGGSAASPPAPRSNARFSADGTGGGNGGGGSHVSPLLSRPDHSYSSSSSSGASAGPLFNNAPAHNGAQFPSPASATISSRSRTSSTSSSSSGGKNFGGGTLSRSESVGTLSHGSAEKSGRPGLLGRLRSTSFFGKKSKNADGGSDAGMVGNPTSSGGGGGGYGTEHEALPLAHGQASMVGGGHHMPSFPSAAPASTPPPAPAPVIRESLASRINKAQLELESDGDY